MCAHRLAAGYTDAENPRFLIAFERIGQALVSALIVASRRLASAPWIKRSRIIVAVAIQRISKWAQITHRLACRPNAPYAMNKIRQRSKAENGDADKQRNQYISRG